MVSDLDQALQERAFVEGAGAVALHRDLIEVQGPDAMTFLQGQLSQDLAALDVDGSAWSFVLQPQGKVLALVRVTRLADDGLVLDMEAGNGDGVRTRLDRFRLRVKAELSLRTVGTVAVRGPRAAEFEGFAGSKERAVDALWPALPGFDLFECESLPASLAEAGVVACDTAAWEAVRIRAGLPVNGTELDERTIPAESGLVPLAASMTKGCYVGQELVARIDSRGRVNRHLRRLSVEGDVPPRGTELLDGERAMGAITSAAFSALSNSPVALGYVRREIELGASLTARWDSEEAKVVVDG